MAGKTIRKSLKRLAMLLEIKGENPFKPRAYYNAAKTLSAVDNLDEVIREKKLKRDKGDRRDHSRSY